MKEFLNVAMKKHDGADTKKVANFFEVFPKVTKFVVEELGTKPFHLRGPLNVSALDSVLAVLIQNYKKMQDLGLEECYERLKNDEEFDEYTRINTTDTKVVRDRCSLVREYLFG